MSRFTNFVEGDLVHCIKRGAFGQKIFRDQNDYWRFVRLLYLCNDVFIDNNANKIKTNANPFERPAHWPDREPLTDIISWCAMPNHFHILLIERQVGGVGKFMQRLCSCITNGYNLKYKNQGSIFQAKYKPVLVIEESHLYHLIPYINVKNVLELYPGGGLKGAFANFDTAWEWARGYSFSSSNTFISGVTSPILSYPSIQKLNYPKSETEFKSQSLECIELNLLTDTTGRPEDLM